MNKLLIILMLFVSGCDYRSIQDFLYPASMYLQTPNGGTTRIHCKPRCPKPQHILQAMTLVESQLSPHTDIDIWKEWNHFAITFGDEILTLRDGRQAMGATWQISQRIYIWYDYKCANHIQGICPGVLGWELKLPIVNKILGGDYASGNDESAKIRWLTERGIENIMWRFDGTNIVGIP